MRVDNLKKPAGTIETINLSVSNETKCPIGALYKKPKEVQTFIKQTPNITKLISSSGQCHNTHKLFYTENSFNLCKRHQKPCNL